MTSNKHKQKLNTQSTGKFRMKRRDTLVKSIEKKYKIELETRSDMQLGNYLKKKGLPSLSKLLEVSKPQKVK